MKNVEIGSVTDIPIRINVTLLLFLPVLAWLVSRPAQIADYAGLIEGLWPHSLDVGALQSGTTPLVVGTAGAVGLFVGVLIHELGHSWTARRYGVGISSITLWIFGGMAHMEELPEDWNVEFWIAIAGPITSLLLAVGFGAALQVVPASLPVVAFVVGWLAVVNLSLAVFNMLPAFPMDGGRILRALLARNRPYVSATRTAASVAKVMALLMAVFGLVVTFSPLLVLIALFVYVAATSESRATVLRDLLKGLTAGDMLSGEADPVSPSDSLQAVLDRVLVTRRGAVAVVEGGSPVGIVTLEGIPDAAREDPRGTSVESVMRRDLPTVGPETEAFDVLMAFGQSGTDHLLVVDEGRLVGIVSQSDLAHAIEVVEGVGGVSGPDRAPDGYA